MNDIRPFRGLRFDEKVVGPLGRVVCPPYDVISPDEQERLHASSPYNVVRLELGMEAPGDYATHNRYSRAAATLQRWMREGALVEEAEPALYLYEQRFTHSGSTLVRRGLLANLRLAPWEEGVVLPHEETMAGPKADRLELMRATACDISPIFLLFDDPSGTVAGLMEEAACRDPDALADTGDGQLHSLWVLTGDVSRRLAAALRQPQLYVADGHHRYETELAYKEERRRMALAAGSALSASSEEPWDLHSEAPYDFGMMLLVDARDPGLVVLPTHRIVRGVGADALLQMEKRLQESFLVDELPLEGMGLEEAAERMLARLGEVGRDGAGLGLYRPGRKAAILRPRPGQEGLLVSSGSLVGRDGRQRPMLDVDLLHEGILAPTLGIGPEQLKAGSHVVYTRSAMEAMSAVESGQGMVAFLLNPTRVDQVLETARAGGRMPQKSTYFYPKPVTGLVMSRL